MHKQHIANMPQYFDRYINLVDDLSVIDALKLSLEELKLGPIQKWRLLGDKVYAPGKWTIKDMLQHIVDTERVFTYRITAIARGDKQTMLPFDEDVYAIKAQAHHRKLEDLVEELSLLRQSIILMYKGFTQSMLQEIGNGANGIQYSPLALGFMLAGHQRWHFKVLEERYYPLIS
jgi:hypothetical protein